MAAAVSDPTDAGSNDSQTLAEGHEDSRRDDSPSIRSADSESSSEENIASGLSTLPQETENQCISQPWAAPAESSAAEHFSPGFDALAKGSSTPAEAAMFVEDEVKPECMICLERPPTRLFEKCGHLGVCGCCATGLMKEQYFINQGSEQSPSALKRLKMTKENMVIANENMACPYCREVTKIIALSQCGSTTIYPV